MDIINFKIEKVVSNHLGVHIIFAEPPPVTRTSTTVEPPPVETTGVETTTTVRSPAVTLKSPVRHPHFEDISPINSPLAPPYTPPSTPAGLSSLSSVICNICNYRWDGYAQHTCLGCMQ